MFSSPATYKMFHTKIFALLAQYAQFRSPKQKKNQLRFEQQNLKKIVKMKKASLEKTKKNPKSSKTFKSTLNKNFMRAIYLHST